MRDGNGVTSMLISGFSVLSLLKASVSWHKMPSCKQAMTRIALRSLISDCN